MLVILIVHAKKKTEGLVAVLLLNHNPFSFQTIDLFLVRLDLVVEKCLPSNIAFENQILRKKIFDHIVVPWKRSMKTLKRQFHFRFRRSAITAAFLIVFCKVDSLVTENLSVSQ